MKSIYVLTAALCISSLALARDANALTNYTQNISGASCIANSSNLPLVDYNAYGVYNNSTTASANVTCSVPWTPKPNEILDSVQVHGWSRRSGSSVSCFLFVGGRDGTPAYISPSFGAPYVGGGSAVGSVAPSFDISANSANNVMVLSCTIPAATPSVSVLSSIFFSSHTP